jgi:hypothetical protein
MRNRVALQTHAMLARASLASYADRCGDDGAGPLPYATIATRQRQGPPRHHNVPAARTTRNWNTIDRPAVPADAFFGLNDYSSRRNITIV